MSGRDKSKNVIILIILMEINIVLSGLFKTTRRPHSHNNKSAAYQNLSR